MKKLGISNGLDYFNLNFDHIKTTLLKVLEDRQYSTNAKKLSALIQDQKEKPLDKAIWWIEWLMRNPDCHHLKSPVLRLGHIAGNGYDVIAIITLFVTFVLVVGFKVIHFCVKKIVKKFSYEHIKVE